MKPLITIQKALTLLCICRADETKRKWIKFVYVVLTSVILAVKVSFFCSSTAFFLKNMSSDLDAALFALLQMVAGLAAIYTLIVALVIRYKIRDTIKNLTDIYDTNAENDSFRFLTRVNIKCEWIWEKFIKFVFISILIFIMILSTVSVLISWLMHGTCDTKYFLHVYQLTLPWNQQTVTGYFFEVFYSVTIAGSYTLISGTFSLLFICFCFNHQAFYERFRHSLRKMANKNRIDKGKLCELIRFHCITKNFLSSSAGVFSPFIMIQLISMMLILAGTMFQLDLQTNHLDLAIFFLLIIIFLGISQTFVYCHFGKLASESYGKMADRLYEFNWYEQPLDLQRYFVLMIQNAQIPVYYHGFGFAVLDLQLFTKLMKAVFTYYMVLKTIASK